MNVTIENFVNDRPGFQNQSHIEGSSLLGENREIRKLQPSEQIQNVVLLFIHRIFQKIICWLYPFERINHAGIVAAFDRSSSAQQLNFANLNKKEFLSYFKRFFNSDEASSPDMKACIDQLSDQYEAIEKLTINPSLREPFTLFAKGVEELDIGKQQLILANASEGDELFYLFSRSNEGLNLKIIGRGGLMLDLSGVLEVAVAGKAKIPATMTYRNIDLEHARKLLEFSPLQSGTNVAGIKDVLEELEPKRMEDNACDALATKTDNFAKVFWTVLKQVNQNAGKQNSDLSRAKLRSKIFTLFDILKTYRYSLPDHTEQIQTLHRMLRICSQDLLIAQKKGMVSKDELDELANELAFVQKAIDTACESAKTSLSTIKIPGIETLSFHDFTIIPPFSRIPDIQERALVNTRLPVEEPLNEGSTITWTPSQPTKPLLDLSAVSTVQEIIHTVYAMDFSKSSRGTYWKNLSKDEAKEIMEQFHTLSERLVDLSQPPNNLLIDTYEVLTKMTAITAFLNHTVVNEGTFTQSSFNELSTLNNTSIFFHKTYSNERSTIGYCIHPENAKTYHELQEFYEENLVECQNSGYSFEEYHHSNDGLLYLEKQRVLFDELLRENCNDTLAFENITTNSRCSEDAKASIFRWLPSLPLSFLAIYHNLSIQMEDQGNKTYQNFIKKIWKFRFFLEQCETFDYRNTQEGIVDDPEGTVKRFVDFMMNTNIAPFRDQQLSNIDLNVIFHFYTPFRQGQLGALLENQAEYLLKASEIEPNFSKEQLTALLLLLRADSPQSELMAFMHTHDSMLSDPSVRDFIELLFFHPSLLKTLKGDQNNNFLRPDLPRFFSDKIDEYRIKAEKDPNEPVKLVFFLKLSEKLKGIYETLGYETKDFFSTSDVEDLLATLGSSSSVPDELILFRLKTALKKPHLTEKEISLIIIDMQALKKNSQNKPSFDRSEILHIEGLYQELLNQLTPSGNPVLSNEYLQYTLDMLCIQKDLPLDASSWSGSALCFENDKYLVNLMYGTIVDKVPVYTRRELPRTVLTDPLFKNNFPDVTKENIRVMMHEMPNGDKVYLFEDTHHNLCRIEEKKGVHHYYKSFPKKANQGFLQAISIGGIEDLSSPENSKEEPEESWVFFATVEIITNLINKLLLVPKKSKPFSIFQKGLFVDPQNPEKGYVISKEGDFEFEVEFEKSDFETKIKNVFDLRGGEKSEARQVTSCCNVDHPALKMLEQFENPEHILLWGEKTSYVKSFFTNSSVDKVEFPRYGLSFSLCDGQLICDNPKYAGYRINLSASLKERKGFAFSILLEHPDHTYPGKLLLPDPSLIVEGPASPEGYSGLAYVIWLIKAWIDVCFYDVLPFTIPPLHHHIESNGGNLELISVDLHPHTGELIYEKGKEASHSQKLISQAILLGDYELGFEVLHSAQIDKQEKPIREWIRFIQSLKNYPIESAIGLKIIEKISTLVGGEDLFKQVRKQLRSLQVDLFKTYLQHGKKLPASLRLDKTAFEKIAATLKKKDPAYYQRHITPFFREVGDSLELPVIYTDGRESELHEMAEQLIKPKTTRTPKISQLEELLHPEQPSSLENLSCSFTLLENATPLLFEDKALSPFFTRKGKLISTESAFLRDVINPKKRKLKKEFRAAKETLDALLSSSSDPLDQIAVYAKEKRIATPIELMLALLQNDFESLKKNLPNGIDIDSLKKAVTHYYDLEVKVNLITKCKAHLFTMIQEKENISPELRNFKSSSLFELLKTKRHYSAEKNPELLIFEAFHFMTFRDSTEANQLELLRKILENPMGIAQAGTGSGKSSVLSVARALIRPNGSNLVSHKALPHLYKEMLALMDTRLGKTFKRKVYPLRFDFTMPLKTREGSIFKSMYQRMLETMQNKGCILTDYKSYPLLEEKFWSVSKELLASRAEGLEPDPLQLSHWTYLRKILILLQNKGEELMDEFDEPNRPVHRIQIQIKPGEKPPKFIIEESLALYDRLLKESDLKLAENLQGEISPETRMECLSRVAEEIAREKARGDVSSQEIHRYLLGKGDEALTKITGWTREEQDTLALLKDQFYTYLPLTLSQSGISKYQKSADGNRIVTCVKGDPREAKFGNILEEINYSIQEYVQHGVALPTLSRWVREAIKDLKSGRDEAGAKARFNDVISGVSLEELACLNPDDLEDRIEEQFLTQVNQNQEAVRFFLERHLDSLRSSGYVASMTPQDIVAMSRAVSGISATVGSAGSLHSQFQTDKAASERVRQEMIDRIKRRSLGEPLLYDPADPLAIFNSLQTPITAIIDGSGAFREIAHEDVAKMMMQVNPSLKKVEYYGKDGSVQYVGDQNARVEEKGFYFPQAYTRGSDQVLKPDGIALLTVNNQDQIEDLGQQEGRMRLPGQKVIYALSQFAPSEMQSLSGIIERKEQNEEEQNAVDRFRSEPQRLRGIVRFTAKQELLKEETLDAFLPKFDPLQDLFIQSPASAYENPGDYFNKHQNITPRDCDPIEELGALKEQLIQRSVLLGLPHDALSQINYSNDLRSQMPRSVAPLTAVENQQLEVEEEEQVEQEEEQEEQQEEDVQTARSANTTTSYPPRVKTTIVHSLQDKIHPSFSPKIEFTESFLPLNRKDPLHRRKAFDDKMFKVGSLKVFYKHDLEEPEICRIVIGDLLDDLTEEPPNPDYQVLQYDIRTGRITHDGGSPSAELAVRTNEFKKLAAQVKFFGGQIEGYNDPEELNFLTEWFAKSNNADQMRTFFEQKILRNQAETFSHYQFSQLWTYFERSSISA